MSSAQTDLILRRREAFCSPLDLTAQKRPDLKIEKVSKYILISQVSPKIINYCFTL